MNQTERFEEEPSGTTRGPRLSELLMQLEDYSPTIPDAVTTYYLRTSGFEPKDPRIVRLISIAAQKFMSDIANDALQHCKMRTANVSSSGAMKGSMSMKERRLCLTTEDLSLALSDYGITLKKPPYIN